MITRVKQALGRFFRQASGEAVAVSEPDGLQEMSVDGDESDAPLPPAVLDALRLYQSPTETARYRVEHHDGERSTMHYEGDNGTHAVEAWERVVHSDLAGRFTFHDKHHPAGHRGSFTRGLRS